MSVAEALAGRLQEYSAALEDSAPLALVNEIEAAASELVRLQTEVERIPFYAAVIRDLRDMIGDRAPPHVCGELCPTCQAWCDASAICEMGEDGRGDAPERARLDRECGNPTR